MKTVVFIFIMVLTACGSTESKKDEVILEVLRSPSGVNSSLPYLSTGQDQQLYLSWVSIEDSVSILMYSTLNQNDWSTPQTIANGSNWFVNWADYPMVSANEKGQMIAHYLAKSSSGTYSYNVNIVHRSKLEWEGPIIPHSDSTPTEHGFVSMIPLPDNTFQVAWLDGRNTAGSHDSPGGAMTVRTAIVDTEGNISEETELDDRVCDCCQTTGALTDNGPVFIYRNRSEMEIRDMAIVRKVNGEWTEPMNLPSDNWEIAACPVNGPRADAIGNNLAVAWFTAANGMSTVKVAFSVNGGASFEEPIIIDGFSPLGRVDLVMLDPEKAMISWMTNENEKTLIKAQVIDINGTQGESITIAEGNDSRGSGFPQMEVLGNTVFFAWTHINGESTEINMKRLSLK